MRLMVSSSETARPSHRSTSFRSSCAITWRDREELDRHLAGCWHCVDQFCRFRETLFLSRRAHPLPEREAEAYLRVLGIEVRAPSRWKRLLGK